MRAAVVSPNAARGASNLRCARRKPRWPYVVSGLGLGAAEELTVWAEGGGGGGAKVAFRCSAAVKRRCDSVWKNTANVVEFVVVRSFVRSFVCSFVCLFVRSFVGCFSTFEMLRRGRCGLLYSLRVAGFFSVRWKQYVCRYSTCVADFVVAVWTEATLCSRCCGNTRCPRFGASTAQLFEYCTASESALCRSARLCVLCAFFLSLLLLVCGLWFVVRCCSLWSSFGWLVG